MLRHKVFKTINEKCLLNKGDKVLAALSGGADSVSLLIVLKSLELYDISAAHVNHGIRGKEADRDEAFCRELCEKLGIPLYVKRADVPTLAQEKKLSLETCARDVRYGFFEELCNEYGFDKLATAHTAEDNAETVIMNMGRGAGLQGICGIPVKRGRIIRPLLFVTKEEILEYLKENNQPFVTDSTNFKADCVRNTVRLSLMPKITEIYPDFAVSAGKMTQSLIEDSEFLNSLAQKSFTLNVEKINTLPAPIKKRVLVKACKEIFKTNPERVHIEELCRLCQEKKGISALPNGVFVSVVDGELALYRGEREMAEEITLTLNGDIIFGNFTVRGEIAAFDEDLCRKINNSVSFAAFDCDIITKDIKIGTKKSGDKIFIAKRNLTKSVKKLLNECSVSPEKRDSIPVIRAGNEVLWVYGYAKSGKFPPKANNNALILKITERDF